MELEDVSRSSSSSLRADNEAAAAAANSLPPRQPGGRDFVSLLVDVYDSSRGFIFGYPEQFFFGSSIAQCGEEGEIYRLAFRLPGEKDDVSFPSVGFFKLQLSNTRKIHVDTGLFHFQERASPSMLNTPAACSSSDISIADSVDDMDRRGTKRQAEVDTEPPPTLAKHFRGKDTVRVTISRETGYLCFQINVGDIFKAASAILDEKASEAAAAAAAKESEISSMQLEQ